MNTKTFITSAFSIFILCNSLSYAKENNPSNQSNDNTITMRADLWMPYNGNPESKQPGYMIEIAEIVFKKHGYKLDYQLMPWERSLELVNSGNIDCVVGAFEGDARSFVFNQISYGKEDVAFYGRSDARSWEYKSIESFKGYGIGVIGGYSYGPEVDYYIANPNNKVFIAKGEDALDRNIKMLLSKRIDILIESPTIFEYKIKNMPSGVYTKELDRLNKPQDIFFACSPAKSESELYTKWLDEGITELRKKGKLKKILAKYGLKDWEANKNPEKP